jgi:hypothetical protein
MHRVWTTAALLGAAVLLMGCDDGGLDSTVTGKVMVDDRPAPFGEVNFYPVDDDPTKPTPRGLIDPDGSYTLKVGAKRGLPSGEYRVAVTVMELSGGGPNQAPGARSLISPVYGNPQTSGLQFTVKSGSNTIDLKLKGK